MSKRYSNKYTFIDFPWGRSLSAVFLLLLLLLFTFFGVLSCDQSFYLVESLDGPQEILPAEDPAPLSLSPASVGVFLGSNVEFTASGGIPPYSYSIIEGSGLINDSGVYTAPAVPGAAIVRLTDSNGSVSESSITVSDIQTNVDYDILSLVDTSPTHSGGDPLSASFDIINQGVSDGTKSIYWYAYLSNDGVLSGDDDLIDTGVTSQLSAGLSQTVNLSGQWPENSGTYQIIIQISASDDIQDLVNNTEISAGITVSGTTPDNIDYAISSMPPGAFTIETGDSLSGSFVFENLGADSGGLSIYWTAYASLDMTVDAGTDIVVDSGIETALNAGQSSSAISLSGYWPAVPGDYYILILLSAGDDVNTLNNSASTAAVINVVSPVTISPATASIATSGSWTFTSSGGAAPYTYSIVTSGSGSPAIDSATGNYSAGTLAGTDVIRVTDGLGSTSDSTVTVLNIGTDVNYNSVTVANTGGTSGGGPLSGNFTFSNSGTGNGSQTVSWQVYHSLDSTIGAGDSLIDSGTTSPLNSSATSAPVPFSGTWPIPVTDTTYYLVVNVQASEDNSTIDNSGTTSVLVTAPVSSDIDYVVQSITNTPSSADVSTPVGQSFVFYNQGSDPGAYTVYWKAWISDDTILDGGDSLLDSGSTSALGASASSASISIGGNWPAGAGIYYLLVQISSADDIIPSNNVSSSSSFTINATASDIDYVVTEVTADYPTVSSGSLIAETFTLSNIGGLNGSQVIDWNAYASSDNVLDGGDVLVGSGTTAFAGLNSGASYGGIPVSGSWPATGGQYYLIVDVSSGDETVTGNNNRSRGVFDVSDPPDYSISSVTVQTGGTPSQALSNAGVFDFVITENSGNDGKQPIGWKVYASVDNVLDAGDTLIRQGSRTALQGMASSGSISFGDAVWPAFGSYYYLIVNISAGDDENSSNDTYVTSIITVPENYVEGAEDNSDIGVTAAPLLLVSDLGTVLVGGDLDTYELIRVDGIMDVKFAYDTYKFVAGPGVTEVDVHAVWSTGFDEIDLAFWDESSNEELSEDWSVDGEPLFNPAPPATFSVIPGATYYIGVKFMRAGGEGASYSVFMNGR